MLTYKSYVSKFFQAWKTNRLYFTTIPSLSRHFPRCPSIVEISSVCKWTHNGALCASLCVHLRPRAHKRGNLPKGKDRRESDERKVSRGCIQTYFSFVVNKGENRRWSSFRRREDLSLVDLQCFMVSVSLPQQIIAN